MCAFLFRHGLFTILPNWQTASEIPSVNRIDLQAINLAGPTVTRSVPDPLAVLSLNNRLWMMSS